MEPLVLVPAQDAGWNYLIGTIGMIIILCFDPPNVPGFEDPPRWPSCAYVAARPSRLTKKAGESLGDPYDLVTKQAASPVRPAGWKDLLVKTWIWRSHHCIWICTRLASFACSKSAHFIHGCMSCVLAFRTWQEQTRAENVQDAPH